MEIHFEPPSTFLFPFQSDLERMNQELDALNSRKGALEDELAMSQVKKEAVVLYDQLREVEDKRDQVMW